MDQSKNKTQKRNLVKINSSGNLHHHVSQSEHVDGGPQEQYQHMSSASYQIKDGEEIVADD